MRQRAPFVWIASQPIVDDGTLGLDHDVTPRDDGQNRFFYLRRDFDLPAVPQHVEIALTTDGRYQLFVNGAFVGRGPARSDPLHKRVDRHVDVAHHLRAGRNTIAVLVRCYGRDNAFYMLPPDAWRRVFGDGGLWLDARFDCGAQSVTLTSDTDWRALRSSAWIQDTPPMYFALGPIEWKDARVEPVGWTEPGFDASDWEACVVQRVGGGGPEAPWAGRWIEPFPLLVEREIPFAAETERAPVAVRWVRAIVPGSDLSIERRLYDEQLGEPLPTGAAEALTRNEPWTLATGEQDVGALFDFGQIHAGHPVIEIEARGGEIVELAVAERLSDEFSEPDPLARIVPRRSWHGHDAHIARYVCRPGLQRFERFDWSAVKYLQLAVRNAPQGLTIRAVVSRKTHYPVPDRGRFVASDPLLGRIWDVGKRTLTACMHDAWIDCPSREARQWLGDVAVEYPTASVAFGPEVAPLARQFLRHAAESQHADGLTEMFAPGDHRHGLVRIPDWSIMWVLVAHQHWRLTGDLATPASLLGQLERVLDWFARFKAPSGLVADLPYWRFVDWAGVGRDGESAIMNALYVAGCGAVADLSAAIGDGNRAQRWRDQALDIAAILAERHWDDSRGIYVDVVDSVSGVQQPRVSQHANMALILWDIAPRDRWARMIDWCLDPARVKVTKAPEIVPDGETMNEATDCVSANTFFAHFVYEALTKAGRVDLVLSEIRRRYEPMIAAGATTLWESYSPAASLCHGFSAAPLWQFSASILGVRPATPGYATVDLSPDLADLDAADGIVLTVAGDIVVALRRHAGGVVADVTAPAGVTIVPRDSGGLRFTGQVEALGDGRIRYFLEPVGSIRCAA